MQNKKRSIHILPQKRTIAANPGERLLEALMRNSIFLRSDCGGKGKCHKCRIDKLSGRSDHEPIDACQHRIESDITITIPESSMATAHIMKKARLLFPEAFTQKFKTDASPEDYGVAVDLGTTTIAIYLCDLARRKVIGSIAIKNSQAVYGDDVMSRISTVAEDSENLNHLHDLIIKGIEWGANNLISNTSVPRERLSKMVIVGNPTMIHILAGTNPSSIGIAPFLPSFHQARQFSSDELGFSLNNIPVHTLPNVSGFIGGDIIAAAIAAQIKDQPTGTLLIDLGTNGELILKAKDALYATSCATGPAFEGATLSCGMQGIPGAIDSVEIGQEGAVTSISIINPSNKPGVKPAGVCGTGVLNAVSALVQRGIIKIDGAFSNGSDKFVLVPEDAITGQNDIYISQKDIRSVQLGKSALISGIEFLLNKAGLDQPDNIIVAGAMGSHAKPDDLIQLGMIPHIVPDKIEIAGNLAGSGAVMALCDKSYINQAIHLAQEIETIELETDKEFQNTFIKNLSFPVK